MITRLKHRRYIIADDFDAALFRLMASTCHDCDPAVASPTLRSGRIRDAKLSFRTNYDADIGKHKLQDINGNWRLHDATLGW